jgi:hypothetical protein
MGNRGLQQHEGAERGATRGFDVMSISMNVKMRKKVMSDRRDKMDKMT